MGDCAADQLLPCLLVGVDNDGHIREIVNRTKHGMHRTPGKSEVIIGGRDRRWCWGTIFVGSPVTFMLG